MSNLTCLPISEKTQCYVRLITEVLQAISLAKLKLKKDKEIVSDLQKSEEQLKYIWVELAANSLACSVLKAAVRNGLNVDNIGFDGEINLLGDVTSQQGELLTVLPSVADQHQDSQHDINN